MEECKIRVIDENGNSQYIRYIMFQGNKEVVINQTAYMPEIAIFDKEIAKNIINYLNQDRERLKLVFLLEE